MYPKFKIISELSDVFKFTLSDVDISVANAIRRTILSDIPVVAIKTETYQDNKCTVFINTTRFHNEIVKQRLSCIPIHMTDLDILPEKYLLEVDEQNDTDVVKYVTTEHFKIKNKLTNEYLPKEEIQKIFPKCVKTDSYIDFVRLRPKVNETIIGERIKLSADFSISTSGENSMYSVVSKCSYGFTPDMTKVNNEWIKIENQLRQEKISESEIKFKKDNFYILDAQRFFLENSFDFVIQTIGVYTNIDIVKISLDVLIFKFKYLIDKINSYEINDAYETIEYTEMIDSDKPLLITKSDTTMENSYDISLKNVDYTIGKVLEYIMFSKYYEKEQIMNFCGFKKFHPHNSYGVLRIAFSEKKTIDDVKEYLRISCVETIDIFEKIKQLF